MKILTPQYEDNNSHVPNLVKKDRTLYITMDHVMEENHYIEWVSVQTKFGNQRKALKPGMEPKVCFSICEGDEVEAVYAYCNLHSLWKA